MLRSLFLRNFRGFKEHRIYFGPETILVGKNNAGKTTVIEALRVLSVCQARASTATLIATPDWLDEYCQGAGFRPSLETIDFDYANVQYAYNTSEPALLGAKFANNCEINVFIGKASDQVFCQLKRSQNNVIHERRQLDVALFGSVKVMPPVGSLLPREKIIAKDRLNRFLDGYLAYRHFRNQMWERVPEYRKFKELIESTWHGLQIQHFENDHGPSGSEFSLLVREGRFTSEISWHGHGLQAWAQTIWFLARTSRNVTIVLDEPDVYLHADLQRKLIKVIESLSFRQSIIATHSPEIISDVPFKNVVVVQKRERISKPAARASDIQMSLRGMGSIHSIQLSKIAERGLILFVEGDDKIYLSDVAFKMGTQVFDRFSEIAIHETGGKGNWQRALGAAEALYGASEGEIQSALLLDSDYMLDHQRTEFKDKAVKSNLHLKIWKRKEIENYFIIPTAISRHLAANCRSEAEIPTPIDVERMIESCEEQIREDLTLSYSETIRNNNKGLDMKASYRKAKELIEVKLAAGMRVAYLASGKDMISRLSKMCQDITDVGFSALAVCKECMLSEIDEELKKLVEGICSRKIDEQILE